MSDYILADVLRAAPEIAVFLALGLGDLIGKIRIGSFTLGAAAGTLLMGLVMGIVVPDSAPGRSPSRASAGG
jgi:uncharacterized transporter YbjL